MGDSAALHNTAGNTKSRRGNGSFTIDFDCTDVITSLNCRNSVLRNNGAVTESISDIRN